MGRCSPAALFSPPHSLRTLRARQDCPGFSSVLGRPLPPGPGSPPHLSSPHHHHGGTQVPPSCSLFSLPPGVFPHPPDPTWFSQPSAGPFLGSPIPSSDRAKSIFWCPSASPSGLLGPPPSSASFSLSSLEAPCLITFCLPLETAFRGMIELKSRGLPLLPHSSGRRTVSPSALHRLGALRRCSLGAHFVAGVMQGSEDVETDVVSFRLESSCSGRNRK